MELPGLRAALALDSRPWVEGLNRAQSALQSFESSARGTFDRFNNTLSSTIGNAGRTMAGFGAVVTASMAGAVAVFSDFDRASRETNSILRMSETEAARFRGSIRELTRDLGLNVSAAEAMRGAYAVASAGFTDAEDGRQVLTAGLRLAKAGLADTQSTLNALSGALKAYGKDASAAGDFSDILFKTVELGQTTIPELAQTLARATTTAANAGVSFDELGAAIAAMTVKGSPTATVMDSLNQAILQMQAPSEQARKALASVGLQADSLGQTLRTTGLRGALVQLFQATRGDVATLRAILGDVNAVKAAQALGAGGGADFAASQRAMGERSGAAARGAAETAKALSEQIGQTKELLTDLALSVGEALTPTLIRLNGLLQGVVAYFGSLPESTKQTLAQFAAIAGVMAMVGGAIMSLIPALAQLTIMLGLAGLAGRIPMVVAGLQILMGNLPMLGALMTALAGRLPMLLTGMLSLARMAFPAVLAGLQAVASGFLQLAPPVVAISAVVYALVAAWRSNFAGIREIVSSTLGDVITILQVFGLALRSSWSATWGLVTGTVDAALTEIEPIVVDLVGILSEVGAVAGQMLRVLVDSLGPGSTQAIVAGMTVLVNVMTEVKHALIAVVRTLVDIVRGALAAIRLAVAVLGEEILALWEGMFLALQGKTDGAMKRVADGFRSAQNVIIVAVKQVMQAVLDWVTDNIGQAEVLGFRFGEAIASGIRRAMPKALPIPMAKAAQRGPGIMDLLRGLLPGAPTAAPAPPAGRQIAALPPPGTPDLQRQTRAEPGRASGAMSEADMRAYIRRNADVAANIDGLTKQTLQATFRLVENAMREGIRLGVTSGKRFGAGKSLHDIGQAVDVTIPGEVLGSTRAGAIMAKLAAGTGFRSGINEYLPEALRMTGGTGPHVHMAMREDGKGIPGFFRVAGATSSVLGQLADDLQGFRETLARAFAGLAPSEFSRRRGDVEREARERRTRAMEVGATPEDLRAIEELRRISLQRINDEELQANQDLTARLLERRLEASGQVEALNKARIERETAAEIAGLEELALKFPARRAEIQEQIRIIAAAGAEEVRRVETEAAEAKATRESDLLVQAQTERLADLAFRRQLGTVSRDEAIAAITQELEAFSGSVETKRQLTLQLLELYRQDLQERLALRMGFDEQSLEQEAAFLAAKTELTMAEEARLAALRETMAVQVNAQQEQVQRYLQVVEDRFAQFLGSALTGQMTFAEAFRGLWKSLADFFLQEIARMIAKVVLLIAKMTILRFLMGGAPVGVATAIGPTGSFAPGLAVAHSGGLVTRGGIRTFHQGGKVSRAPGFASSGVDLRPDEVLAKLQTGEVVLSRDQVQGMTQGAGSGSGVTVYVSPSMVQAIDPEQLGRVIGRDIQWRLQGA